MAPRIGFDSGVRRRSWPVFGEFHPAVDGGPGRAATKSSSPRSSARGPLPRDSGLPYRPAPRPPAARPAASARPRGSASYPPTAHGVRARVPPPWIRSPDFSASAPGASRGWRSWRCGTARSENPSAKTTQPARRPHERVLRDVVSVGGAQAQPVGKRMDHGVIAVEELLERGGVPSLGGRDECGIIIRRLARQYHSRYFNTQTPGNGESLEKSLRCPRRQPPCGQGTAAKLSRRGFPRLTVHSFVRTLPGAMATALPTQRNSPPATPWHEVTGPDGAVRADLRPPAGEPGATPHGGPARTGRSHGGDAAGDGGEFRRDPQRPLGAAAVDVRSAAAYLRE